MQEATRVGAFIESHSVRPTAVLCSSAARSVETLLYLRPHLSPDADVRIDAQLYLASSKRLMDQLRELDDSVSGVLLLAHNPGIAELASVLTRDGRRQDRERMARSFPPASLAALTLDLDAWSEIRPRVAHLEGFTTPGDLD